MWSAITARLARWNGIASLRDEARAAGWSSFFLWCGGRTPECQRMGLRSARAHPGRIPKGRNMATKWEYLVLTVTGDGKYEREIHGQRELVGTGSEQRPLNELGEEGWDLVTVVGQCAPTGIGFFKRPVREGNKPL